MIGKEGADAKREIDGGSEGKVEASFGLGEDMMGLRVERP